MRRPRRVVSYTFAVLTIAWLSASLVTKAQPPVPLQGFPDWKAELLGAASHAALFGHDEENSISGSSSPFGAPDPGRPPRISANTRVNAPQVLPPAGRLGRSETSLSVSGEGNFLVAGWNDADGFARRPFVAPPTLPGNPGLSGYAFSRDGGTTWTDGGTPFISGPAGTDPALPACGGIVTRGDPWLDTGGYGNDVVYYANLGVYELPAGNVNCTIATFLASAGVSVHRGQFTGASFAWNDVQLLKPVSGVGLSAGFPLDFYDKESLAADKNGSRQHVFVSVTNFVGLASPATVGCGFGQIELWHSYDGGFTWASPPTLVQIDQVQTTPTVDCSTGTLNQGSQVAVGSDGEVYVAWQHGPSFSSGATVLPLAASIRVSKCDNFGAGPCTQVLDEPINSMRLSAPQGYNRNRQNDFPRVAVAPTGRQQGRVYLVYPTGTGAPICFTTFPGCIPIVFPDSNILLKFSDDGGTTWSAASNVNPPGDGRKDFWPVVSADKDGNVDVVYYSSAETNVTPSTIDIECIPGAKQAGGGPAQDGRLSSLVDVFWAQSLDGGSTFQTPMQVNSATSNWCKARTNIRPTFGDYIDAKSFGNRVFVTWADGRLPAPAADTLAPPAGPRDRESDVFYSTIKAIGRAPR